MDRPTVLVTGMSGLIGGAVRRQLGARYELRALNRRAVDGVPCHRADIADLAAIEPAFKGVDAVVHLAASVGSSAPLDELLRANVIGAYNVFEAARATGLLGLVPSARHRPDHRGVSPGARDASLRRLLRRLEQPMELPRPRPRAPGPRLRAPGRGGDVSDVGARRPRTLPGRLSRGWPGVPPGSVSR